MSRYSTTSRFRGVQTADGASEITCDRSFRKLAFELLAPLARARWTGRTAMSLQKQGEKEDGDD